MTQYCAFVSAKSVQNKLTFCMLFFTIKAMGKVKNHRRLRSLSVKQHRFRFTDKLRNRLY